MLKSIIESFKKLFEEKPYVSELEQYIISHEPTSNEDVEYLTRRFDQIAMGRTRGLFE